MVEAIFYYTHQFQLFISWYLQYCKKYKPEVFARITTDANIKQLYSFVETQSASLINSILANRKEVLKRIEPYTAREGMYIKLKTDLSMGYGIDDHISTLAVTDSLLQKKEHSILSSLRSSY